ncbi:MAG: hypothetical protein H6719_18720 [Sandaracinaceae bacterium]|nr:hypothetical protein [Sandaracinaceae bacterium]
MRALMIGCWLSCAWGCGSRTGLAVDDPEDAGPCVMVPEEPQLDLLFVIDDSASMEAEQEVLARGFEGFARALATGDLDGDGVPEFPPVTDLHVGVVSTDMGWLRLEGRRSVPAPCPGDTRTFGDDGVLREVDGSAACGGASGRVLSLGEGDSVGAFSDAFACIARTGTDGCGFEMPLEATLKALTTRASPLRFAGRTRGHADDDNVGFLREDSLIAVVVVTDEDDGSLADASFDAEATAEARALGEAWLHPIERYVEGLRALRPGHPERVAFAAVAGIPPDLGGPIDSAEDAARVLDDPRMARVFDPSERTSLVPACTSAHSRAAPARRLVELAGAMGGGAVVWPICEDDFRGAAGAIATQLGGWIADVTCAAPDGG